MRLPGFRELDPILQFEATAKSAAFSRNCPHHPTLSPLVIARSQTGSFAQQQFSLQGPR